jgi:biopolymer transport protein ExbB/TolQ
MTQRLYIINFAAVCLLVWAWVNGYVQTAFAADTSGISYAIVALLVAGLASVFIRARAISASPSARAAAKMPAKNAHITEIAKWCAALGMFGTVIGLIKMALSLRGMDVGSAQSLSAALSVAFDGYGVALVTTAVGLVAGVWLEVNALIINTETECLIEDFKP